MTTHDRYRIDEHDRLELVLCGRLAEESVATATQWWRGLIVRTIVQHNTKTIPGNCTISIYSPLLHGEIVLLLNPIPQPPVCYIGYAPDILAWDILPENTRQEIQRELDVCHHKN